jgi:hypothetical protein
MYLQIEVELCSNSPIELVRVFNLLSEPRKISQVFTGDPMNRNLWCDVTGWCDQGACHAMAALSEDSGDGVVLLVYGGNEGIRLKPTGRQENWEVGNPNQWGEACLLLDKETAVK